VTVRSIVASRLSWRSLESVVISSRLVRVAASISITSASISGTGGVNGGRSRTWVFST
jgi:hypothetical protein